MADNQELTNKVIDIHNLLNPFIDSVSGVLQRHESFAQDAEAHFDKLIAEIASLKSIILHGNEAAPVTGAVENPPAEVTVAASEDVAPAATEAAAPDVPENTDADATTSVAKE